MFTTQVRPGVKRRWYYEGGTISTCGRFLTSPSIRRHLLFKWHSFSSSRFGHSLLVRRFHEDKACLHEGLTRSKRPIFCRKEGRFAAIAEELGKALVFLNNQYHGQVLGLAFDVNDYKLVLVCVDKAV